MSIFIDNNDLEEQYGEQKYQEYLEKENKQMKQDITTMNKEIERLNNILDILMQDMALLNATGKKEIKPKYVFDRIAALRGVDKE